MRNLMIWVLPPLLAAGLLVPERAAACSCVATPIYRSDPVDEATDVPLNQAIMVEGVFDGSTLRLEDAEGTPVDFELNAGPWPGCPGSSADVLPKTPLVPNTRYVVRVDALFPGSLEPSTPSSISFTTGSSMLPDPALEPPRGAASVVHTGPEAMCGRAHTVYTCLDVEDAGGLELIVRKGDDVLMRTTTLVQDDGLYALESVPDCVELRRRSRTGKRSEPRLICGDALGARPWVATDSGQFGVIACREGVIGRGEATREGDEPLPPPDVDRAPGAAGASAPPAAGAAARVGGRAFESSKPPPPSAANDRHVRACAAVSAPARGGHAAVSCMAALVLAFVVLVRRQKRRGVR